MVRIFVNKCLFTQAHPCANLFNFYAGNYNTRFSNVNNLTVPRINSNLGRQSITCLVPKSFNSVPREYRQDSRSIHTFKSKLKTTQFSQIFDFFFFIRKMKLNVCRILCENFIQIGQKMKKL